MDSIVLELQRKALDKEADVAELVRMAMMVARKLRLKEFERWARLELDGYNKKDLPHYRRVNAEVKAHNPYHGWIPVIFRDSKQAKLWATSQCTNKIGELQYMVTHDKDGESSIQLPFSHDAARSFMQDSDMPLVPTRLIAISQIVGILDSVRNIILDWALELEQNEILGEGLTFSSVEKKKAASTSSIHIAHFQGVLGDVHTEKLQIGDYNSIHEELKQLGITQDARNDLENTLDEYKKASNSKKKAVAKRGLAWVAKHADTLAAR